MVMPADKAMARRTLYRGIQMRSRLEARAAQFIDSIPNARWAYEPSAYADRHGQYLPDFELAGVLPSPLFIEVRGILAPQDVPALHLRMQIIWSSRPEAALAVWTPAVIEDGAPFTIRCDWFPPEQRVLRSCVLCAAGVLADGQDWASTFTGVLCLTCEARAAA